MKTYKIETEPFPFGAHNFIQVNIDDNGKVFTCYLTNQICIVPGIKIYYIPPIHWDKIREIFPTNSKEILYPISIDDAIAFACTGHYTQLEMIVLTTGKNTVHVLRGHDDAQLLH